MNRHRILAVASKEWREILRDRLFLPWPLSCRPFDAAVWLWPVAGRQPPAAGVIDYDRSASSRAYIERFSASQYFTFKGVSARRAPGG